ncbi:MAG: ABC transporter permease [Candidatus Wallbacteria bacterium]|nr:ABC transporter permease [Candidatus Wallbacteria bacterium]
MRERVLSLYEKWVVKHVAEIGIPRLLIGCFVAALLCVAYLYDMNLSLLLSDSLVRVGRNGILVLALLPAVQGGLGLNFGLPVGVAAGLVGLLVPMNLDVGGWKCFLVATALAAIFGWLAGLAYGWLLNRVKGQEMMVGTYVGFSAVSGMCIFWLLAPFHNRKLIWPIGGIGLRTTLPCTSGMSHILDNLGKLELGQLAIPTGLLLYFLLLCGLVALFFRTRTGLAIRAAGENPLYAKACGISEDRTRLQAAALSTMLAAIGIVAFSSSYGFVQLYQAPLMVAFPAVAALLIGGGSVSRASVSHVVIGTLLFQTLLTIALPVANKVVTGDISEVARVIVANGMILYALTRGPR